MRSYSRFSYLSLPLLLLPALTGQAVAQTSAPPPKNNLPPTHNKHLDQLFAQLAKAQNAEEATPLEGKIEAVLRQSGSPTIDLLLTRGENAMGSGDKSTALQLFTAVTELSPNFARGWYYKAQLQAITGDDAGALLSLQKVLTLNPRDFQALANLGSLLSDYGDQKGALAAYRKAQVLTPANELLKRAIRGLARDVEGEKI